MKVVALVSGGKDSCYAMMKCIHYGHQIVALANLMPADDSIDELDSFMYQTVGHQILSCYTECIGVPIFRKQIQGYARDQALNYRKTPGDEVEDLFILLSEVKRRIPSVTAVSSGAIASDYQRLRVESICSRLGLVSLAYLWKQDQSLLLQEMINSGIKAITVKVAAMGLDPTKHLGKELAVLWPHLHKLKELYGINVCGEGGEYETLTLDCPLFVNARIVLDESQTILHSPDSIASVGVLHPLVFHLETKEKSTLLGNNQISDGLCREQKSNVSVVEGDCPQRSETACCSVADIDNLVEATHDRLHISKTTRDNGFSICCWLQGSCNTSAGLVEDLHVILKHIESQLAACDLGWKNVLYIHLYISDMDEFTIANEMYVRFITHDKCPFGVPSRSTIELPLLQEGLGRAYVEVLAANDNSKKVLHVQSISSWAPSCIGPYSQATLHKEVLYMAGQLGLDPPTMTLCNGGPTAELEQALQNSEAVAECFNSSISTSAILFTVYCSTQIPSSERVEIQNKQDSFLKQMRLLQLEKRNKCKLLNSIILYILVPDLPKRAFVEVKPLLFVPEDTDMTDACPQNPSAELPNLWGFNHLQWHDSCIQKCVVSGKICAVLLSITEELVAKICCDQSLDASEHAGSSHPSYLTVEHIQRVSRFCIYLLQKVLVENAFSWEDITNMRLYFRASLGMTMKTLSAALTNALKELAEMGHGIQNVVVPIFNIVPVLGAGESATCMDNIITCEVFGHRF